MSMPGSVTHWVGQLKAGERDAAQQLWEAYFRRLVGLARKKLQGAKVRTADEEDVALSAFDSFCRGAEHGRFPQLGDRNDLWRLLVVITGRKAIDLIQKEGRQKRGGGALLGESALLGSAAKAWLSITEFERLVEPHRQCRSGIDSDFGPFLNGAFG